HYPAETALTPAQVKSGRFQRLPDLQLHDPTEQVYAQPLYVHGLTIPDQGKHNVLFVATQRNNVYAFDADQGGVLWTRSLGIPAGVDDLNPRGYDVIYPVVGITSTPVIDRVRNQIYLVSMATLAGAAGYIHTLY